MNKQKTKQKNALFERKFAFRNIFFIVILFEISDVIIKCNRQI